MIRMDGGWRVLWTTSWVLVVVLYWVSGTPRGREFPILAGIWREDNMAGR